MFSAREIAPDLTDWSPMSLKQRFLQARREFGFNTTYRAIGKDSAIYHKLPGIQHTNKRFFEHDTIIENMLEAIILTHKHHSRTDAIHLIQAFLESVFVIPGISQNDHVRIVDSCLYAVINPNFFTAPRTGTIIFESMSNAQQKEAAFLELKQQFKMYYNRAFPTCTVYTLSAEKKAAFHLVSDVFAESKNIPALMDAFFVQLSSIIQSKIQSHTLSPLDIAAFVHNEIIKIHPFDDGNGRLARVMMNKVLTHYGLTNINVNKNTKQEIAYDQAVAWAFSSQDNRVFKDWIIGEQDALEQNKTETSARLTDERSHSTTLQMHNELDPLPMYPCYLFHLKHSEQTRTTPLQNTNTFSTRHGLFSQRIEPSEPFVNAIEETVTFKPKGLTKA